LEAGWWAVRNFLAAGIGRQAEVSQQDRKSRKEAA